MINLRKIFTGKVIKNLILGVLTNFISVIVLQLALLPKLNEIYGESYFGQILVILGVVNVIGVVVGNSGNNLRLVNYKSYKKMNLDNSDFDILVKKYSFFAFLLSVLLLSIITMDIYSAIIFSIVMLLIVYRSYLIVVFRENLNYVMIFLHAFIYSFGLFLGYLMIELISFWWVPYLLGEIFSILFLVKFTKFSNLKVFKLGNPEIESDYIRVILMFLILNLTVYLDRFILYPVLGSEEVTIIYVSSLIPKMLITGLSPVLGVVLSYISKLSTGAFRKYKPILLITSSLLIVFSFLISILFYHLLIPVLYSNVVSESSKYIVIISLSYSLILVSNILAPFILRYKNTKHNLQVQLIYFVVYLLLGIIGSFTMGLIGFAIALLVSSIIKLLVSIKKFIII